MRLNVTLTDPQVNFLDGLLNNKVSGFIGARGSGKSTAVLYGILKLPQKSKVLIVTPTYRMAEDITLSSLFKLDTECRMRFENRGIIQQFWKSKMKVDLVNGTTLLLRSGDKSERLRGLSVTDLIIDEGGTLSEDAFLMALACCREGASRIIIASTPAGRGQWMYKHLINSPISSSINVVHSTIYDNPSISEESIKAMEAAFPTTLAKQELQGEWIDAGAVIQQDWLQVIDGEHTDFKSLHTFLAIDTALSTNTNADFSCIAVMGYDINNHICYVLDVKLEHLSFNQLEQEAQRLFKLWRCSEVVVEKTGAGFALIESLTTENIPSFEKIPQHDKIRRATRMIKLMEERRVFFVDGWVDQSTMLATSVNYDGLNQLLAFSPCQSTKTHDDCPDALSWGINHIFESLLLSAHTCAWVDYSGEVHVSAKADINTAKLERLKEVSRPAF